MLYSAEKVVKKQRNTGFAKYTHTHTRFFSHFKSVEMDAKSYKILSDDSWV
jgi:hypothetical protein